MLVFNLNEGHKKYIHISMLKKNQTIKSNSLVPVVAELSSPTPEGRSDFQSYRNFEDLILWHFPDVEV